MAESELQKAWLRKVELWLYSTQTTAGDLGRAAGSRTVIYQARNQCTISEKLRGYVDAVMLANPNGIKPRPKLKKGTPSAAFSPGSVPQEDIGRRKNVHEDSQSIPVPALGVLPDNKKQWVREKAFAKGISIPTFLGKLVELGIEVFIQDELEEHLTQQEQAKRNAL